ncbi:FkbM family methyltransferase [Candidatus Reidiella endopervernicosa]|uniref:FkbM family methyltransferase n=1 Tax=Candidatus Reidiella endopervernicosa TaxID=2738883 RepID=A0A6N0HU29_9GAMM|nr:FkbM family methyltransferase [Candidatus Reidiella endopervernicosa]QKQ25912.1 FkbM family methyltransferase [Candidatus Reidiella endopervernicosa]
MATGFKTNGYFVEFGASDGIKFSNTYLLEKEYGWQGILAEPGKIWHTDLANNRDAAVDHSCVWSSSHDTLSFTEADVATLSTISKFSDHDHHAKTRKESTTYEVKTLSLNDLLEKHNAPRQIDYLSIDTEGSEFEILNSFNFDKYEISIITCEHNFTRNREQIFNLLSRHGYRRKFTTLSKFDDWYFKDSVFQAVEEHGTS